MTEMDSTLLIVFLVPSLIALWRYENRSISPEKRYRTFWPRFLAGFVDGLVFWPLYILLNFILRLDAPIWLHVTVYLIYNAIHWVYTIFLHGKYGQTVGKMVTRVLIVDAKTNGPISFRHAFLRDSIAILIMVPAIAIDAYELAISKMKNEPWPSGEFSTGGAWAFLVVVVWLLAEVITMLTNARRRAIHDFVAGTVVVRTNLGAPVVQPTPEPIEDTTPEMKPEPKPRVKRRFSSVFR
ncbi:MAG: RDD family protein [Gemmatimonadota bacterium]|nr:RDD family protein [Gemmatimonadota bacterium]